jgi:hypothetical protein
MADFTVRSDVVNVEQIMEQIRARIREKRGVDYTEEQLRELADIKLQKFLDPRGVRSDLLEQFRRAQRPPDASEFPNYSFEEQTLFESHRGPLRFVRRLLQPILKLFFNPNPLIQALNIQSRLNTDIRDREVRRRATEALYYELIHNLVVETTRLGIEVKNLTMRVESMAGRLEFAERRARALESAVVYKAGAGDVAAPAESRTGPAPAAPPSGPPAGHAAAAEGPGQRSRRRRRRRGRRSGAPATSIMGGAAQPSADQDFSGHAPAAESVEQALGSVAMSDESRVPDDRPAATPAQTTPPRGPEPDAQ